MADFAALHTALSGLRAARFALDTASQNVANASTRGYSRQRVELTSRPAVATEVGWVGSGVQVVDITRSRDVFLDMRFRTEIAAARSLDVSARLLEKAEAILGEPEGGISGELDELWASFETWALDPPDSAARLGVLAALESVVTKVRSVDLGWVKLAGDVTTATALGVDEANLVLRQVADLNRAIDEAQATAGTPNDLLDERDRALDRLAELIGATARTDLDGNVRVVVEGRTLVDGATVRLIRFGSGTITDQVGNPLSLGGELGGRLGFLDDLTELRSELDSWVIELATQLNGQHAAGFWAPGQPGGDLVTYDPSAPAATLKVAISDPEKLANSADPYAVYDGSNAQALAGLRSTPYGSGPVVADELRDLIARLGQATASRRRAAEGQTELATATGLPPLLRTSSVWGLWVPGKEKCACALSA